MISDFQLGPGQWNRVVADRNSSEPMGKTWLQRRRLWDRCFSRSDSSSFRKGLTKRRGSSSAYSAAAFSGAGSSDAWSPDRGRAAAGAPGDRGGSGDARAAPGSSSTESLRLWRRSRRNEPRGGDRYASDAKSAPEFDRWRSRARPRASDDDRAAGSKCSGSGDPSRFSGGGSKSSGGPPPYVAAS